MTSFVRQKAKGTRAFATPFKRYVKYDQRKILFLPYSGLCLRTDRNGH